MQFLRLLTIASGLSSLVEAPALVAALPLAPERDRSTGVRVAVVGEIDVQASIGDEEAAYDGQSHASMRHDGVDSPVDRRVLLIGPDLPLARVPPRREARALVQVAVKPEVRAVADVLDVPAVLGALQLPLLVVPVLVVPADDCEGSQQLYTNTTRPSDVLV